jgi:A/G-specific adenine glycosylase
MNKVDLTRQLLQWYQDNARDLPWRRSDDPYRIWISEVMLQQTRVETVIPYYENWMASFPDLDSLANSSEEDILRIWEGLGYYRRVENIIKASRILVADFKGKFPRSVEQLKKLPGIGDYIAGALASIALGMDEIALDGNGMRVLSRLYEYDQPVNDPKSKKELGRYMRDLLPSGSAGYFNQAVMDLGSQICTPRNPKCEQCPIHSECRAFKNDSQASYPLKKKRAPLPHYEVVAAVIQKNGKVLIDKRRAGGLLGGLWEFPGGKVEKGESHHEALVREIKEELGVDFQIIADFGQYKHAYTHFKVTVFVFRGKIIAGKPAALESDEIRWTAVDDLGNYPMGKVDRLISLSLAE